MKTNEIIAQRANELNVHFAGTGLHAMPASLATLDQRMFFIEVIDWLNRSCFPEDLSWQGENVNECFATDVTHDMAEEVLAIVESWCLAEDVALYGTLIEPGSWMLSAVQKTGNDVRPHFGKRRSRQVQLELLAA